MRSWCFRVFRMKWPKSCIPKRFVLCFMIFVGYFNLCSLRNTLPVALVTMTKKGIVPETIWNLPSQSVILMSFYPSIIATNFLSGWMSSRFSGKTLCGLGIFLSAVVTLFLPLAAERSCYLLMMVRFLQGLFQGCVTASFCTLFGKWLPKSERAVLKAVCTNGMNAGFLLGSPITGYLCASNFLEGWPVVFYLFGLIAVLWALIWWIIIYEYPADHPNISDQELKYILGDQGDEYGRKVPPIPWKSILSSLVVWSLLINGMCMGFFGEFIRLVYPTYLDKVYNFHIEKIGWLMTLPHVLDFIMAFLGGALGDFLVSRYPVTRRTLIRKMIHIVALLPVLGCLVGVTLLADSPYLVVALITSAFGLGALNAGGSGVGVVEISPVFTGAIAGICNGFENIVPIVTPLIIGVITAENQTSPATWNTVFYIGIATHCVGSIIYLAFGSADLQRWGLGPTTSLKPLEETTKINPRNARKERRKQ